MSRTTHIAHLATDILAALAHAWESRALTGRGFALEFDPTLLDCARELRGVLAVLALLDFVGRCRG